MSKLFVITRRELKDVMRNRFFVVLFLFLTAIMFLSVVVASADFSSKVADYNTYLAGLKASGAVTMPQPQLFPLKLLRGSSEYLELIGALFAIIVGYGMIAKEKKRGTLQLLFSRPLKALDFSGGKILTLAVIWLVMVIGIFIVMGVSLLVIGNASLSAVDIGRLAIVGILAWLYLLFWSCLAMGFTSLLKRPSAALITSLVLWLIVVLIMPQIGDTMDPDNQVPGGLFASLKVDKAHEKTIIARFKNYENARNAVEISSITKQYERPAFAYLGIKEKYNQKSISYVTSQFVGDMLWLFGSLVASIVFALWAGTKRHLLKKEE